MKNKEKYAKEIIEIACDGNDIAVNKSTGKPESCRLLNCNECFFSGHANKSCNDVTREWAESEYIEKPVISKRDREFLGYIREEYKFVARDENGKLAVYESHPIKRKTYWISNGDSYLYLIQHFNVAFPMVKWEDSEPWLIEDLKKLEVVEEYD